MVVARARIFLRILPVFCLLANPALAASWEASVDQTHGLPTVSKGGRVAMSGSFAFWRGGWNWAGLSTRFDVVAPYLYSILGDNKPLDFTLDGRVTKPSADQLLWDFDLNAHTSTADVIGGGISFRLDPVTFGPELGEPELLADNRGWAWGRPDGPHMEMRFEPPLAKVYFEKGQKSEIRAFFFSGEVPRGRRHYVATFTVGGGVSIGPSMAERYGLDSELGWPINILDWRSAPVDLSFFNAPERPAGKHGFLGASGDKLSFADGTPARFWGTNLAAAALFGTSRADVALQARRLSALGFNLVRFHHHDSSFVSPNIFGDGRAVDTRSLSPAALDKLDWWIKCLESEGIYVWLDLQVGRQLRAADDIADFGEIAGGKPSADLRGYNYVNASIERAMQRFNEAYLAHRNRYTGVAYRDDPGIAAVLLTNENDVTSHFSNRLLPDKNAPGHSARYLALAEAFASKYQLPKDRTWRSWEQGPSKLFLNDLEHRFDADMIEHLRNTGVKVPIVTTSAWGDEPLSSLPALLSGDIVDVHAYGGVDEMEKDPHLAPTFVDWMAAAHVLDRPLSATEWNVSPFPAPDRHASPLYVAGAASLQGWAAPMQFAYSQQALDGEGKPSNWDAFNDPGLLATLPAAALLYRRGDVQEAKTVYVFAPSADQLFNQAISPKTSVALRTAVERGKLVIAMPVTPQLPWLAPSRIPEGAELISDPDRSLIDPGATSSVSDSGELRRDWGQGTYTIDTPRTQAAMGWIGGKEIALSNVKVAVTTRNATVAVQSLDQSAIGSSRLIQISLGARSVPVSETAGAFRSEPVVGHLTIEAGKGLKLYRQSSATAASRELPVSYVDGRYQIDLDRHLGSYWLQLR